LTSLVKDEINNIKNYVQKLDEQLHQLDVDQYFIRSSLDDLFNLISVLSKTSPYMLVPVNCSSSA